MLYPLTDLGFIGIPSLVFYPLTDLGFVGLSSLGVCAADWVAPASDLPVSDK